MAFLKPLYIEGFRGIIDLKMEELKPVNIVVGDNNCGKTSVLEAIQLLRNPSLANVYRVARQRESLSSANANSVFDSFLGIFPQKMDGRLAISVSGICNDKKISFRLQGTKGRILVDSKELSADRMAMVDTPYGEVEANAFDGSLRMLYGDVDKEEHIRINQYSVMTGTPSDGKDQFPIIYVSSPSHLRGDVLSGIIRKEGYKQICVKALQLFDPGIEDIMIFKSDIGNRPVEYIRHRTLGDMPVSSYGDGIKKVLALSNAITQAVNGILLIDEVETAIHKKYYDEILRFIIKACRAFHVQVFITTHSLEAIDGLLATQDYDRQDDVDNICVCTIRKGESASFSRVLTGREVYENRDAFGFEVRL